MPSLGQNGGAMNDSLAQHSAQTPSPSTGSRQATHSVGSAMSSASRAACTHAPRHAFSAPRRWAEMDRDGDASASIRHRLASGRAALKPADSNFRRFAPRNDIPARSRRCAVAAKLYFMQPSLPARHLALLLYSATMMKSDLKIAIPVLEEDARRAARH